MFASVFNTRTLLSDGHFMLISQILFITLYITDPENDIQLIINCKHKPFNKITNTKMNKRQLPLD